VKLPVLSPTAKAQLWGMAVGFALALYVTYRLGLGLPLFFVGWIGAWIGGEMLFGARLIGRSDAKAIALALASGFAFPWFGLAVAALGEYLRP
jgi:hypothetical protein